MPFFSDFQDVPPTDLADPVGTQLSLSLPDVPLPSGLINLAAIVDDVCEESEKAFTIYALSQSADAKGILFILHGHEEADGTMSHFTITLKRRPENAPPQYVIDGSEKIGGYPAALERIFGLFGSEVLDCIATGYFFSTKVPVKIAVKEKKLGPYELYAKRLVLTPPSENEKKLRIEYQVLPKTKGSMTQIHATVPVRLSASSVEEIAAHLWQFAAPIYD